MEREERDNNVQRKQLRRGLDTSLLSQSAAESAPLGAWRARQGSAGLARYHLRPTAWSLEIKRSDLET